MLYSLYVGNVPTYEGDQDEIVYLVTDIDALEEHRRRLVFTDRNAVLGTARFSRNRTELDEHVDWQLMESPSWHESRWGQEGRERRMAEMLVYRLVPWAAFLGVATRFGGAAAWRRHKRWLRFGVETFVGVRPEWYF